MRDSQSSLPLDLVSREENSDGIAPSDGFRKELEMLFAVRRPDFIRFLARLGINAVDAEDITQDVFLRLFDTSKIEKRPERPYEWLLTCARNLALKHFRKQSREIQVIECVWKKWERIIGDPSCDVVKECENRECSRCWREAIAALDSESQQCILLRADGVTFREISLILNLPIRRVVYLTNEALAELQAKLGRSNL